MYIHIYIYITSFSRLSGVVSMRSLPFDMHLIKLLSADQWSGCHQCGLALGSGIEPAKEKLSRSLTKIKTMVHERCLKMHGKQKVLLFRNR